MCSVPIWVLVASAGWMAMRRRALAGLFARRGHPSLEGYPGYPRGPRPPTNVRSALSTQDRNRPQKGLAESAAGVFLLVLVPAPQEWRRKRPAPARHSSSARVATVACPVTASRDRNSL